MTARADKWGCGFSVPQHTNWASDLHATSLKIGLFQAEREKGYSLYFYSKHIRRNAQCLSLFFICQRITQRFFTERLIPYANPCTLNPAVGRDDLFWAKLWSVIHIGLREWVFLMIRYAILGWSQDELDLWFVCFSCMNASRVQIVIKNKWNLSQGYHNHFYQDPSFKALAAQCPSACHCFQNQFFIMRSESFYHQIRRAGGALWIRIFTTFQNKFSKFTDFVSTVSEIPIFLCFLSFQIVNIHSFKDLRCCFRLFVFFMVPSSEQASNLSELK